MTMRHHLFRSLMIMTFVTFQACGPSENKIPVKPEQKKEEPKAKLLFDKDLGEKARGVVCMAEGDEFLVWSGWKIYTFKPMGLSSVRAFQDFSRISAFGLGGDQKVIVLAYDSNNRSVIVESRLERVGSQTFLTYHESSIRAIAVTPEGGAFAIAERNRVKVWDIRRKALIKGIEPMGEVSSVGFSPTGDTLAIGIKGNETLNQVSLFWRYDFNMAIPLAKNWNCERVAFSKDGTTLATTQGNDIWLWDVRTLKKIKILSGHTDDVTALSFSPSNKSLLVTGGKDDTWRLWDYTSGNEIWCSPPFNVKTFSSPESGGVTDIVFSNDGNIVIATHNDGHVRGWGLAP